jgi:hypothetical protein
VDVGYSFSQEPGYQDKGKRSQNSWRGVLTDIRKPYENAARTEADRVVKTRIRIEPNFDGGDRTIPGELAKSVNKILVHFIHRHYSRKKNRQELIRNAFGKPLVAELTEGAWGCLAPVVASS